MRRHGMSPRQPRRLRTRQPGESTVTAAVDASFLEPPARSFLRARAQQSATAGGSCRSRGRQERAHRSLENRQTGFPQLPPALFFFHW